MSQNSVQKKSLNIQIRWMIRRDMADVLRIEQESFDFNWTEEDFLACLRQRNCIGMVAELDNRVIGFMIYELHKTRLHVINFAVAREHRRLGIGSQMIAKLVNKLSQQRRHEILLEVRETNLGAQKFFQSQSFKAVCVVRNRYEDSEEDAYVMRFRLDADALPSVANPDRLYRYGA